MLARTYPPAANFSRNFSKQTADELINCFFTVLNRGGGAWHNIISGCVYSMHCYVYSLIPVGGREDIQYPPFPTPCMKPCIALSSGIITCRMTKPGKQVSPSQPLTMTKPGKQVSPSQPLTKQQMREVNFCFHDTL